MRNLLSIFLVSITAAFIAHCGLSPVPRGGVENGNGFITGRLYTEGGAPAQNATVKLFQFNQNPQAIDTAVAVTQTDAAGKYDFPIVPQGVYNVMGDKNGNLLSFDDSLTVKTDSLVFSPDTLKIPGRFKGVAKLHPYRPSMVIVVILGTNLYTTTFDTIGNFTSPKLAEGHYRVLIVPTSSAFISQELAIDVVAGQIITLDTIHIKSSGIDSVLVKTFNDARLHLPGSYQGIATTPWVAPYPVVFTIDTGGHYTAFATESRDNPALYWGTDNDYPQKSLSLVSMNADGSAVGKVTIVFSIDSIAATTAEGEVRNLKFNATFDSLGLEVWNREYGPVQLSLKRTITDSLPLRPLPTANIALSGTLIDTAIMGDPNDFRDSAVVMLSVEGNYPIVYQVIAGSEETRRYRGNFSGNHLWDKTAPAILYHKPLTIRKSEAGIVILARAKTASSIGGVIARYLWVQ